MHEWCADWHVSDYYRGSPDHQPAGPVDGVRSRIDPSYRYTDYGFRVAVGRWSNAGRPGAACPIAAA